jgi:hypothetical protein
MKADITPEPALNAKCDKANSIDGQYDWEAQEEQSFMNRGNISIKTEEKCQEIGRNNQHELGANHQQQAMPN